MTKRTPSTPLIILNDHNILGLRIMMIAIDRLRRLLWIVLRVLIIIWRFHKGKGCWMMRRWRRVIVETILLGWLEVRLASVLMAMIIDLELFWVHRLTTILFNYILFFIQSSNNHEGVIILNIYCEIKLKQPLSLSMKNFDPASIKI